MDPVTQGVVGALASQATAKTQQLAKAAMIGAIAGMTPDLDVLIRSSTDPLLALEYHRQFTHSLFFIPIGGVLCALILHALLGRRWEMSFKTTWLWSTAGFATHALLDGCTSYGTLLLWPFSDQRFSWDMMSIIDPLFTLPLLIFVILASRRKARRYLVMGILWAISYFSIGYVQHERALIMAQQIAESRGHQATRLEVKPSFANLIVWKSIYEANGTFYVDAVKPGMGESRIWPGGRINKLDIARDLPWLDRSSQQAKDIARFAWFSQGFIALSPDDPMKVVDMRYSLLPNEIRALWGITLSKDAAITDHVEFASERGDTKKAWPVLMTMLFSD